MIGEWLYERITGRPYLTGITMSAHLGPPPAVEFAAQLGGLSDMQLLRLGDDIVAAQRMLNRAAARRAATTRPTTQSVTSVRPATVAWAATVVAR